MDVTVEHLCISWTRFSAYHLARLRAVAGCLQKRGGRLTALEIAGSDDLYRWRAVDMQEEFSHVRLFPDDNYHDIPPSEIRASVLSALDELEPDAVAISAYSTPEARAQLEWCRTRRRTAILMMESRREDVPRQRPVEWVKGQVVRSFDSALAGGSPQVDYLKALGFPLDRVFTPYDVVDNDFFSRGAAAVRNAPESARHLDGLADPTPFFLSSNRFVARKNLPTLLRAYGEYRRLAERSSDEPWRLLLLGDGPLRPELESIVSREAIPGVSFCGFRQVEDLPAYYGLAGAFVHPALSEQWGLVVNEAMAAGLPVLAATTVGAATDLVIEGETGFTFHPHDKERLTYLLHQVASLPEVKRQEMGERARERVDRWSPEAFADGLLKAASAGQSVSNRSLDPSARAILWAIRTFARSATSFHRIRE